MTARARLELRIAKDHKDLLERAAELSGTSVTAFATAVLVERASKLVHGAAGARTAGPRPIGGWCFELPDGWDAPPGDLGGYR